MIDVLQIHISPVGTLWPPNLYPMMFIWRNNVLVDFRPAGMWSRRVKWLPTWFPFNVAWDHSPSAIIEAERRARAIWGS